MNLSLKILFLPADTICFFIYQAINLQSSNELFTELSEHLKNQLSRMEDSCESPRTCRTAMKQESHQHPLRKNDIDSPNIPSNETVSSVKGSQKQRTCNVDKINLNTQSGKCSQHSSNCEKKHNISSSGIPGKEKPEKFESLFDDIDKEEEEQNGSSDGEKPHWFPNPAKYNVEGFDIDARFLQEVCKQRESADGWDTYMKLLSDISQDDEDTSDESDDNDDLNIQNIGSINDSSVDDNYHPSEPVSLSKTCDKNAHTEEIHEEKKSRCESSPFVGSSCEEDNTCKTKKSSENSSPIPKSTKEPSEDGEKERLYFMNGTGIYGIPPSASADNTSGKPTKSTPTSSKPKMDPSENDFYDNLRFYFKVYDSKAEFLNRNKEAEPHVTSDPTEKASSERKKDMPSKETPTCESDRSTPFVSEEKHSTGSSNTHKSRTLFGEHNTGKAEIPKKQNSFDRKGKKGNKNRVTSGDNSNNRQTTAKTNPNKKQKNKVSESTKENKQPAAGREKTTRTTKEEKVKKKIPNSSESSEMKEWNVLQTGKVVGCHIKQVCCKSSSNSALKIMVIRQCLVRISTCPVESLSCQSF